MSAVREPQSFLPIPILRIIGDGKNCWVYAPKDYMTPCETAHVFPFISSTKKVVALLNAGLTLLEGLKVLTGNL